MKEKVDVSVVIVSFNTKEFLLRCLSTLQKSEGVTIETWVVDNASRDGSGEVVRSQFPEVKLIENKENLGFSKANNLAIRQYAGRYILLLNPDTEVMPNTLGVMVNYLDKYPRIGASTCRVELPTGELDKDCRRSFPTPWVSFCHFSGLSSLFPEWKIFGKYQMTYLPENEVHEVDACMGAFMMVRREVIEKIGLLDEDYFFYGEDIDWCFRIKEAGWKITYNPEVKIIHYAGISSGIKKHSRKISTATRESKTLAIKARFDAMRIFYAKHYKNKYPLFINFSMIIVVETKRLFANFLNILGR